MVTPIANTTINRGLCPHGMPFSACPICSGKGGGGGTTVKEMSWDECYSIGLRMKAQAQRTADAKQYNMELVAISLQNNQMIQAITQKMAVISEFIQKNIFQPISDFAGRVLNFAGRVLNFVASPIIRLANIIMNSPIANAMKTVAENIQKGFSNIYDKLAAIIGEPMMAAAEVVSEIWKKIKPKKFIFFSPIDTEMEQGEQEEEVELKKWLHIKSFKNRIEILFKKGSKERKIEW